MHLAHKTGGATQAEGVKRGHQLEVCDHAPCTQNLLVAPGLQVVARARAVLHAYKAASCLAGIAHSTGMFSQQWQVAV
jgi:hypothetical protein